MNRVGQRFASTSQTAQAAASKVKGKDFFNASHLQAFGEYVIHYARVSFEVGRQTFAHQNVLNPGSFANANLGYINFLQGFQNGAWRAVTLGQVGQFGLAGIQIGGFFIVGEMIGRRSIIGYKAALNKPLQTYFNHTDEIYQYEINMLYSIYSFPNIILPLLGGWLIDSCGAGKLTVLLSLCQCTGQYIVAIGVHNKSWLVMYIGRIIFGLGGESLFVAQARLTTNWFRGKELAFAMGVNLAVARMGSVLNDFLSPVLGLKVSIQFAFWVGAFTCFVSFLCSIALYYIDKNNDPETGLPKSKTTSTRYEHIPLESAAEDDDDGDEGFERVDIHDRLQSGEVEGKHFGKVDLRKMFTFPKAFWILCAILNLMYATVIPFNTIHSAFLQTKWYKNDPQKAGQVMGLPDMISALLVPFVGSFADRFGHRTKILILCGLIQSLVHFILGISTSETLTSPLPSLLFLGFAYALLLTFWPCISLLVHEKNLATALGVATATSNLSWTVFPVIVAFLTNYDPTYYTTEMFFSGCCFLGCMMCVWLFVEQRREFGDVLEFPVDGKALVSDGGLRRRFSVVHSPR